MPFVLESRFVVLHGHIDGSCVGVGGGRWKGQIVVTY